MTTKIYDKKKYNKTYSEKNKDRKKYCENCKREYDYLNFSHHKKTQKHLNNEKKGVLEGFNKTI